MKNRLSLVAILISLITLFVVANWKSEPSSLEAVSENQIYERIMRTGVIRCSYQAWPPLLIKDPNSGQLSGVYVDLMDKISQDLQLKVEWVEEVGTENLFESIRSGRTDMLCSAVTPDPRRVLIAAFSRPIGYMPFHFYGRENDSRFDIEISKANDPSVKLVGLEGYIATLIAKEFFPKASFIALPNMATDGDVLLSIAAGKADGAVCDATTAKAFIKHNPGKIKQLSRDPLRFPATALAFPLGEEKLQRLMDSVVTSYIETGLVDKLWSKYGLTSDSVLRPAKPYEK